MKPLGRDTKTLALFLVSGLTILYIYFSFLIIPWFSTLGQVGRDVRAATEQVRALEAATANEQAIKEQYRQLDEIVTSMRRTLPTEEQLPDVIKFLSELANETGVEIETIFPQRTIGSPAAQAAQLAKDGKTPHEAAVYTDVPIQVDAKAGYHQLGEFLSLVETGEKPMQVATLRISGSQDLARKRQVNLLLRAYFVVAPDTGAKP